MKVIDAIIKLQQLDPNMEMMLDITREDSTMFKLVPVNIIEEVETALGDKCVLCSPNFNIIDEGDQE